MTDLRKAYTEAVPVAVAVTGLVTVASAALPNRWVATAVGVIFLGATWALVWRQDDARVEQSGLALGGLVMPGRLDGQRVVTDGARAIAWAALAAAVTFVPFALGWRHWWKPHAAFSFPPLPELASDAFGQLVIIALPEEAFYRGYLQSRLDEVWPPGVRVLGARLGPGLLVSSAIFALGHLATIHDPARLAVFFPSLLFGWLRARTGGIGASCLFHAACNVFSEVLGRGYGLY